MDGKARLEQINAIAEELVLVMRRHLDECTRCCPNCQHWIDGPKAAPIEVCELVEQRPPARIIAFGCEKYKDNIPF